MSQSAERQHVKNYCKNHILVRPEINWLKLIFVISSYFIISSILIGISVLLTGHLYLWIADVCLALPLFVYGNCIGITLVELYQRYASEYVRRQCSCQPSCSEYAILALKKYYWIKAICLICRRVFITCSQPGYHLDYP